MKLHSKSLLSLCAVLLIAFACHASANLVTNGDFESGDFTGWTQSGNLGFTGVDSANPNSGTFGAFMGPVGSFGFLSQNIATTAGATYDLSFFLSSTNFDEGGESFMFGPLGGASVQFQVFWNGVMIFDTTNPGSSYTQHNFAGLLATGSSTVLEFAFRNDPGFFDLDDVVINQASGVPETFSTLWLALPFIGMVGFSRLRRKELIRASS